MSAGVFTAATLAGLPESVARYFRRVLPEGQSCVAAAELVQEGEFLVGKGPRGWRPFRARQRFQVRPPGFVWEARIRAAPCLPIYVRDAYEQGQGAMRARLLGVFPIVSQTGRPELNAGALQRYLAEAVWFPTALLPGQGVTWEGLDERRAQATLTDRGTTVSLQFRFNEAGDIEEIFTPGRYREVKGAYVPTPWRVRCLEYAEPRGMRIPVYCEVEWELPEGPQAYWRGRVAAITYEAAG